MHVKGKFVFFGGEICSPKNMSSLVIFFNLEAFFCAFYAPYGGRET